jgi:hypothetical protein
MEQTAVEWLVQQLSKEWQLEDRDLHLIEQANEMFEQQIKDAYQTSHISMMTADFYYTEKFK